METILLCHLLVQLVTSVIHAAPHPYMRLDNGFKDFFSTALWRWITNGWRRLMHLTKSNIIPLTVNATARWYEIEKWVILITICDAYKFILRRQLVFFTGHFCSGIKNHYKLVELSVTEDDLTAKTGLTIKICLWNGKFKNY